MALAAGCLWATLVIIGKRILATGADPIVVVGIRATLAFIMLGAVLAVADRRLLIMRARDVPFFLVYGVTVAANYGFYFVALKYTTATMAVLLTYTYPAMLAVMAALFLGERLDRMKVLALVLTLTGCALVVQVYNPGAMRVNLRGILGGLGCALGGAAYAALTKRAVERFNPWTLVLWGFGFGALFLLGARLGALGSIARLPGSAWGWLFLAALVPTLLAYVFFTRALVYVEVTRVCITASIEPVVAAGLAWAFLGERMGALQWLGAAGILAGVFLMQAAGSSSKAGSSLKPPHRIKLSQQSAVGDDRH